MGLRGMSGWEGEGVCCKGGRGNHDTPHCSMVLEVDLRESVGRTGRNA